VNQRHSCAGEGSFDFAQDNLDPGAGLPAPNEHCILSQVVGASISGDRAVKYSFRIGQSHVFSDIYGTVKNLANRNQRVTTEERICNKRFGIRILAEREGFYYSRFC